MSVWSSVGQVKLDQIYTRLSWVKRENTPTGTSLSELKHYGELFTADENGVVPKRILVQGETGIGKSTFVQKLALDWAELGNDDFAAEQGAAVRHSESYKKPLNYDRKGIIQPPIKEANTSDRTCYESYRDTLSGDSDSLSSSYSTRVEDFSHFQTDSLKKFKLVLVVTLKDVSKCQTFREVLSLSRLIPKDKESLSGDLFTYVCNNQDNVLLVFDGYDEYRSGSVAEAHFGPRSTSPIFEIFHRYELRDCTVLVTARSSRADELQESADKHAAIIGFDEGDRLAFMRKVLESSRQVTDLHNFLMRKELSDLARVPLLNLFFCMLFRQEKESLMELGKRKTPLYQAIIRYILQHSSRRLPSAKMSKVKEEDFKEILAEIGKVALESLLKGSQVFEYGELSEKVRGEESVMMGLLQLSENEASLEPTEVVSFIHKSIQEYLAAWFIANRCVLEGNLGGIERHATTLEDCQSMANVFQFVCGLSKDGAIKVMAHFSTVHANDASVDFSQIIPVEETEMPLTEITRTHERFNDLVLSCYREGSSKPDLIEHVFGCTGGIILLDRPIGLDLIPKPEVFIRQATYSWAFFFGDAFIKKNCAEGDDSIVYLYESVKFLDLLHIPLRIFRNSKELKLGDFLTKFNSCVCSYDCAFSSVLCFRGGKMTIYITDLTLMCDIHRSLFIETAASVSHQSLSRDLCSSQSCLKFLTSLNFSFCHFELLLLELLAASRRKCKRLQGTDSSGNGDYVLDFLEQMGFTGKLILTISFAGSLVGSIFDPIYQFGVVDELFWSFTAPRREKNLFVFIDLPGDATETAMAIVRRISPESLGEVSLSNICLTSSAAATLGEVLPKMTSLRKLQIKANFDSCLQAREMQRLFGGFHQVLPLEELCLCNFCGVGFLASLTDSFRFFADLKTLNLHNVTMDEDGFCRLLKSFRFTPNLQVLKLSSCPSGRVVRAIVPYLDKLPKLRRLCICPHLCSEEDMKYVSEAARTMRPELYVFIY